MVLKKIVILAERTAAAGLGSVLIRFSLRTLRHFFAIFAVQSFYFKSTPS